MAGGTWTTQNKIQPGVYIRFNTVQASAQTVGERGVVTLCEPLSWGPTGIVTALNAGDDPTPYTGYPAGAAENRFLTEIFKGTDRTSPPRQALLYRPEANGAAQASAVIGEGDAALTVTARCMGKRGNDLSVSVTALTGEAGEYLVTTAVDGETADQQTVTDWKDLKANAWVSFSGTGTPTANTGTALAGGLDGTVQSAAWAAYLSVIEPYSFNVMIYDGEDETVQAALTAFIKRLAEENGQYAQLVAANLPAPDSQFVINVTSGVQLADGTRLTPAQTCWWVGGAQAGAGYNESLTYAAYPGAAAVSPMLTSKGYDQALLAGELVLFAENGTVKIKQDLDSLVTYTAQFGRVFRKNRVVRLCSTIANDVYRIYSAGYIGQVNNNADGRARLKSDLVGYLLDLQTGEGIQEFSPDDVEVLPGEDKDSVLVRIAVMTVDAIEKIYVTVEVS